MAPFDFLTAPLRSLLGVTESAEAEVERRNPLRETRELEDRLAEAVVAVHRSADSLERQIAVLETLADALPALTESVTRLTDQLTPLLKVAEPLGAAEREASRVEHFFGRRRHRDGPPTGATDSAAPAPETPAAVDPGRPDDPAPAA
jgi:hypothetical protein